MNAPSITCPLCKRVSYHLTDIEKRYCGACHFFHGEIGRELKASELVPRQVVVITKEGRDSFITAWVKDVGEVGVSFYAGVLNLYLVAYRKGDEVHDEQARLHVFEYKGEI
jgi:ribosomal protein L37E